VNIRGVGLIEFRDLRKGKPRWATSPMDATLVGRLRKFSLVHKPAFSRYRRPKASPSPNFTIL
jgi:hypothetical protein